MEQQASTSTVTVEYFDPHGVYKLLAPGLVPRLPLRNLHWQSHAGPLRSIDTLHVELVQGGASAASRESESTTRDDGFNESVDASPHASRRRHQIPGLRRTPYLKVLLVRCDDNESYKASVRSDVREWIKTHTPPSSGSKKGSNQEKHDAFEWLLVHVVMPNTAAATQPRSSRPSDGGAQEKSSAASRWRSGSKPLLEKFRSDFNASTKGAPDRVAQIRIGINDVPYDLLPRVVPAVPSGYSETEQDAEVAWGDLVAKLKSLILSSFDRRVTQYEKDIREKDARRSLPGWNFCTFFILKEGLARGFESVGLVEDALVGYDELSVGLDSVIHEQAATGSPESHGGAMLSYTEALRSAAKRALAASGDDVGGEVVEDLQSRGAARDQPDEIVISSSKKAYRDMILANKVSVFDFRCYIFSRQVALLLRLGNASSTREELLAKLKAQQEAVLRGVAPSAPPSRHDDEPEKLSMLAELCRRTLEFIPAISQVMRQDLVSALTAEAGPNPDAAEMSRLLLDTVDNLVASFAFSVAQQMLAQTSTRALPIPPAALSAGDGPEPRTIAEPKPAMHPTRSSSLHAQPSSRRAASPGVFPGPGAPGRRASIADGEGQNSRFLKAGLEDLAARRAELYMLSRSVLGGLAKRRGWHSGWDEAPAVGEPGMDDMEEVSLGDDTATVGEEQTALVPSSVVGIQGQILRTATGSADDFYRLYEMLTDKALRHYTVASHDHAVRACMADLAVLKFRLKDYKAAAAHFHRTTPFFGDHGWSSLELSMLAMHAQCLDELQCRDDYVRVAVQLLTKACAAERERLRHKSAAAARRRRRAGTAGASPLQGVVGKLLDVAKTLATEVKVPLGSFFTDVELAGPPVYHDRRDSCSLSMALCSLLPEEMAFDAVKVRMTCTDGGPCKDVVFEKRAKVALAPGKNTITVDCNSVVPGRYKINHVGLLTSNVLVHDDGDVNQAAARTTDTSRESAVRLFQRTDALDVRMRAAKHTWVGKNNSLELELSTGWNALQSCEVRVRPATGGLRLLTAEAKMVDSEVEFARPPEAGAFVFGPLAEGTTVRLRFPYSVEQDLAEVLAKVEVTYADEAGERFWLAKSLTIGVSLALGVNVQDVFKHEALLSRFSVSTATASPLRLYGSELLGSELFEAVSRAGPASTVTVFAKQPATLLYRVRRKAGARGGRRAGRTMHLRLHYGVVQVQIEEAVGGSVAAELEQTPGLRQYARLAADHVVGKVRRGLQARDLERAALLGEMTTAFLEGVAWEQQQHFGGLGAVPGTGEEAAAKLGEALGAWQRRHGRMAVADGGGGTGAASTVVIPVEVPAVAVVHTADLRLRLGAAGVARVNQVVPATLHLGWTRAWEGDGDGDGDGAGRGRREFAYEVTAPADTWLLGGRRRGRFAVPEPGVESGAGTGTAVPLVLVPQREGWLPLPAVDVREVAGGGGAAGGEAATQACEVDWRNVGETVRVAKERRGVTVSLDASGPGGGPLVVDTEGGGGGGRVLG